MIYLKRFYLSNHKLRCPNIYPYHVFLQKTPDPFVFAPITVLYGNNGSGKSTVLNIIANALQMEGGNIPPNNELGCVPYIRQFISECRYSFDADDWGRERAIPSQSRYIKSEDILYEVKKIEQQEVLTASMKLDYIRRGMTAREAEQFLLSKEGKKQTKNRVFAQDKFSNGETALRFFEDHLQMDALYLLDEPEVSLSPANQVKLAEEFNQMTRFFGCQLIIATHSPFMLGALHAKIYDLDSSNYAVREWSELENVRYFFDFFQKHISEFR